MFRSTTSLGRAGSCCHVCASPPRSRTRISESPGKRASSTSNRRRRARAATDAPRASVKNPVRSGIARRASLREGEPAYGRQEARALAVLRFGGKVAQAGEVRSTRIEALRAVAALGVVIGHVVLLTPH